MELSFSVKADVCLTLVIIHLMLQEGYDVFAFGHPAVAVDLKILGDLATVI